VVGSSGPEPAPQIAAGGAADHSWSNGLADSPLPIAVVTVAGTIDRANAAFAALLGRDVDDLVGADVRTVLEPSATEAADPFAVVFGGTDLDMAVAERRHVCADGNTVYMQVFTTVVRDDRRTPLYLLLTLADVTEQRRLAEDFEAQTSVLERIARRERLDHVLDGLCRSIEERAPGTVCTVLLLNPDGRTITHGAAPSLPHAFRTAVDGAEIGPAAGSCGTAMFTRDEVIAEDIRIDPKWRDWRGLATPYGLLACWATPVLSTDTRAADRRVLGSFAVYWREPHIPTDRERRLVGRIADITAIAIERELAEQALTDASLTDALTGLPNRRLFLSRLAEALSRAPHDRPTVAVLYIDVDRFKLVNDSIGHDVGDQLLRAVGARLQGVVRPKDTAARLGGDEFAIICENVADLAAAQVLAERARAVLSGPFRVAGREVFASASVGVSVGSASARPDRLVEDADAAMYQAKARGRARVELYDDALRERARARLLVETALRHALARSEFSLHYQPVIDLATGRLAAFEALLRWTSEEVGSVPPATFIPVAEETGMIGDIGQWVIGQACRQLVSWRRSAAVAPVMAINVSPRQLADAGFVGVVTSALAAHDLPIEAILLEITETVLADPMTDGDVLADLSRIGARFSVDDFGTGHSSLARLRGLAVNELKIDRSFIDGLGTEADDSAIVSAIIRMSGALGLDVVAEGVETVKQLTELQRLGCPRAQGFLFARPAPAATFADRLSGHDWLAQAGVRPPGSVAT
jgi:diguanylate cyclase (GGDEF)-like protein/PAS domain S-box-containing protein